MERHRELLSKHKLKVTPQRLAVLGALENLNRHPTAEAVIEFVRQNHPNIAIGTVYNTLETLTSKGIIGRVKTDKDIMRYDSIMEKHHHLYCIESNRIEDYYDDELNALIANHFAKKSIPNFTVDEVKLQIAGRFKNQT